MEKEHSNLPAYVLDNSWEQELNYKLWSTKSSRFQAANRLKTKAHLSNVSLAFLSSYLIIINLVPAFINTIKVDAGIINFFTIAISILLLVYTLIETSNEYKLNAYIFHKCALEISNLYNDLRMSKTIVDNQIKQNHLIEITNKYTQILNTYDNHEPIDMSIFKISKYEYHKLGKFDVIKTKIKYFIFVNLKYYLLIILPPLLFYFILLNYK